MDALTIIIMLILFVIAMIFVFSTALLTPYLGKKNLISVILLGFIVGAVGGAFLLSPIVDDIPDFSRTIIEENVEGTDEISMGLSTNRNITQTIENISSISGVNNVAYTGIEIRMGEEFDSPSSESRFLSVLQNSNDAIDEVTDIYSIIAQGVEYINTVIACKTARLQITLQKEQAKIEGGEQTLAMGFHYNGDEDEYWEDDDDEFWEEDE